MLRSRNPFLTLLVIALSIPCLSCGGSGAVGDAPDPVVASVEPASGGVAGGTEIVITGERLANEGVGANEVLIGGNPADLVVVVSDTKITCRTPPGIQGPCDVTVTKYHGTDTLASGYTYYPPPTVTSITPDQGTRFGGTPVTVTGTGFLENAPGETNVFIGLKKLMNIVVVDDRTIQAETPDSYIETVKDVRIANNNGQDTMPLSFQYVGPTPLPHRVIPDYGKRNGGELVTIEGEYFTVSGGQLTVTFGGTQAADVTRIDDLTLTCRTPPGPNGEYVDVTVSNSNGPGTAVDAFFYLPAPEPTAVTPGTGWMTGGNAVTIEGTHFLSGTLPETFVHFGGASATDVVIVDDNTITCTSPAHPMGVVDVTVGNENGSSTLASGFEFVTPIYWDDSTGTSVSLSDNNSTYINFGSGQIFPMYGDDYSGCYICSNGHVNMSHPYTQNSPRFLLTVSPIINPWQVDLDCNYGTVKYYQTADRFIVTFDGVPQRGNTAATIRVQIHMMWNGILGLVWNGQSGSLTEGPLIGIAPILSAWPPMVDLSSPQTATSSDALSEQIVSASSFDMDYGHVLFLPDGSGGYSSQYIPGVPSAP